MTNKVIKFFIIIVLSLFALNLRAQTFKAGVNLALVSSQVDGDQSSGYHKFGIRAGLYTRMLLSYTWSITTELMYVNKGSQQIFEDGGLKFRIKLNYVEVAALLNFHLNPKWQFSTGLSYGRLIKSQYDDPYSSSSLDLTNYRLSDYNVHAKVLYAFNSHWAVDLRMAYSIYTITTRNPSQYNNLLSIGMVYEL